MEVDPVGVPTADETVDLTGEVAVHVAVEPAVLGPHQVQLAVVGQHDFIHKQARHGRTIGAQRWRVRQIHLRHERKTCRGLMTS